jgi:hypothetical protein
VHSRLLGEPFRRSDRGNHEFPLWAVLRDSPSEDFGVLLRLNTTTKIVTRPFPEIRLASFTDGHWHPAFTAHIHQDRVRDLSNKQYRVVRRSVTVKVQNQFDNWT